MSDSDNILLLVNQMIFEHDKATDLIVQKNREFLEKYLPDELKQYDRRLISFQELIRHLYCYS